MVAPAQQQQRGREGKHPPAHPRSCCSFAARPSPQPLQAATSQSGQRQRQPAPATADELSTTTSPWPRHLLAAKARFRQAQWNPIEVDTGASTQPTAVPMRPSSPAAVAAAPRQPQSPLESPASAATTVAAPNAGRRPPMHRTSCPRRTTPRSGRGAPESGEPDLLRHQTPAPTKGPPVGEQGAPRLDPLEKEGESPAAALPAGHARRRRPAQVAARWEATWEGGGGLAFGPAAFARAE
jgi:hypothetical protein